MDPIFLWIRSIFVTEYGISPHLVHLKCDLQALCVDSLTKLDLILLSEEKYQISLSPEKVSVIETISDLIEIISSTTVRKSYS